MGGWPTSVDVGIAPIGRVPKSASRRLVRKLWLTMRAQSASTTNTTGVTLKGSVATVSEFFEYSVNNILYQREIYPPESFRRVAKYGLAMFITSDDSLSGYLSSVLKQLEVWLTQGTVHKLVLVITSQETNETLERWVFDLHAEQIGPNEVAVHKAEKVNGSACDPMLGHVFLCVPMLSDACLLLPTLDYACRRSSQRLQPFNVKSRLQ